MLCYPIEREIPLLLFLWKWKVSTTAALIKGSFRPVTEKPLTTGFWPYARPG